MSAKNTIRISWSGSNVKAVLVRAASKTVAATMFNDRSCGDKIKDASKVIDHLETNYPSVLDESQLEVQQ